MKHHCEYIDDNYDHFTTLFEQKELTTNYQSCPTKTDLNRIYNKILTPMRNVMRSEKKHTRPFFHKVSPSFLSCQLTEYWDVRTVARFKFVCFVFFVCMSCPPFLLAPYLAYRLLVFSNYWMIDFTLSASATRK